MKSPRAVCERCKRRVRWSRSGRGSALSDQSTAACRRGRRALRFRLVQRKLGGRRVSSLCLRGKPSKTDRNLCERRKAAAMPRFFSPAPTAAECASAVGVSGIRAAAISRRGLRNRGASGYSSWGLRRPTSNIAIGYRVMKRSKTPAVEPLEVADEPGVAERFQRGSRRALSTRPAADSAGAEDERAARIEGARA
jgi:hypothetical protein